MAHGIPWGSGNTAHDHLGMCFGLAPALGRGQGRWVGASDPDTPKDESLDSARSPHTDHCIRNEAVATHLSPGSLTQHILNEGGSQGPPCPHRGIGVNGGPRGWRVDRRQRLIMGWDDGREHI
jgi:hypothetical protein